MAFSTKEIVERGKKFFEEFCVQTLRFCLKNAPLSEWVLQVSKHGAAALKAYKEKFFEKFSI